MQQIQAIAQLLQGQAQHAEAIANMGQSMRVQIFNSQARNDEAVEINDQVPAHFPATRRDLFNLQGPAINAILRFYGLPEVGLIGERRDRLHFHLIFCKSLI